MRQYRSPERNRAIVTSLAAAAVLSGPVFAEKTAVAGAAQNGNQGAPTYLIHPEDPKLTLPPLSDHILLAQLDENQGAHSQDSSGGAFGDDGTAKQYNRGYYTEPAQIAQLVPTPTTLEETEAVKLSDDATAEQFNRGYYREPEMIVARVILPEEANTE